MAYHGYINFVCQYAAQLYKLNGKSIKILEVGIDKGVTFFSIINNLNLLNIPMEYHGVDVKVQDHIKIMDAMTLYKRNNLKTHLHEINSLNYLSECQDKFDILLIDGDHNYPTVSRECQLIPGIIMGVNTLVIFDDYHGRWSNKDLFYKDRAGYEKNSLLIDMPDNGDKQGVKPAVDEFLAENPDMTSFILMQGEPICIINKRNSVLSGLEMLSSGGKQ